jgi:hypothetical protein
LRAARFIQKTIQVTKPTAMIDMTPPKASCAVKLIRAEEKVSSAPKAREITTATPTPSQMAPTLARCPLRTR